MDDREQAVVIAQQRMANFHFRQTPAIPVPLNAPAAKSHARSHSRNRSTTNVSFSTSSVNSNPSIVESQDSCTNVPSSPSPRSRPNSHHRRRSSVSTRRESAEMMGVTSLPETGPDTTGDQSELRRLALWALEGKGRSDNSFIGSFTKVEIPELHNMDTEVNLDVVQALKPKPTLSAFGMAGGLAGKRDSFGKLLIPSSNSLKDQLHTLMEEEEEEEEEEGEEEEGNAVNEKAVEGRTEKEEAITPTPDCIDFIQQESSLTRPTASQPRHRPTNLTLRPLSLTPESLPLNRADSLPTPSPTPSPRVGGLKTLTLAPSPSPSPAPSTSCASSRRQSLFVSPSPQSLDHTQRRQSMSGYSSPTPLAIKRKSSISYKRTNSGEHSLVHLPTPGPTPTSPLPPLHAELPTFPSASGLLADLDRPLSPTEQAFLFRSHTSLLCRISDLEQAIVGTRGRLPPGAGIGLHANTGFSLDDLRDRSRSHERPSSITSMTTTSEPESLPSQPSDEMLQLVSDLKAERDELMRDADGWRKRVAGLDKQVATLTRRVEAERREGWVVRERLGLIEVEKKRVKEESEKMRLECRRLERALQAEEGARMKTEADRDALIKVLNEAQAERDIAEREIDKLRSEMWQLRTRAEQAEAELQAFLVTPKIEMTMQTLVPRRFSSIDSQMSASSATDVEEYVPVGLRPLKLNVVEEEEEDRGLPRDVTSESDSDGDELAHYEDDDAFDNEMIFDDDHTSSSFGSMARSNSHLLRLDLAAVAPVPGSTRDLPSHTKTGSMERGWSFPQDRTSPTNKVPRPVDRFFECLDALDQCDADEGGELETYDSATAKQFWHGAVHGAAADDDELPLFVLPAQPSPPKKDKEWKEIEAAKLEVVAEEEEELVLPEYPDPPSTRGESTDISNVDPVTPRATVSKVPPVATPTKHVEMEKISVDCTTPDSKLYTGESHVLEAAPPPKMTVSPMGASLTTPAKKFTGNLSPKLASATLIPQLSVSSPSVFTSPPKPRVSGATPTLIPRLSTSPKTSPAKRTTNTPPKSPVPAMKLTSSPKTLTTPVLPVFIPQPKMTNKTVTRSSILPPKPSLLTRLSIPQQTPAPAAPAAPQGLTAKLSQQMQSLTGLWSPWSPGPSMVGAATTRSEHDATPELYGVRRYVSKQQQLDKLRLRLRGTLLREPCEPCANCRDSVISI